MRAVRQSRPDPSGAPSRLNIVILDACRDNPFARSFRSISRGLAATPAPAGVFVAYATAPGGVAADGTGRNSPYTGGCWQRWTSRGCAWRTFKRVVARVRDETRGMQTPWTSASIVGDFYFRLPPEPPPAIAGYGGQDVEAWHLLKGSDNPLDFESYVEAFPDSPLAPLARGRLRTLRPN